MSTPNADSKDVGDVELMQSMLLGFRHLPSMGDTESKGLKEVAHDLFSKLSAELPPSTDFTSAAFSRQS